MAEKQQHPLHGLTLDWPIKLALVLFVGLAVATVWVTNSLLTERYTAATRRCAHPRRF